MITSGYSPTFLAEDRGHLIIAVAILFIVLDFIFSILYITARRTTPIAFGRHDFLLILSLIFNLAVYALSICQY